MIMMEIIRAIPYTLLHNKNHKKVEKIFANPKKVLSFAILV